MQTATHGQTITMTVQTDWICKNFQHTEPAVNNFTQGGGNCFTNSQETRPSQTTSSNANIQQNKRLQGTTANDFNKVIKNLNFAPYFNKIKKKG